MADSDVPMEHISQPESSEDENSSAEEEEEDAEPVESLVSGRQRRSTAGNKLASLLEREDPDEEDDIGLLFKEDGSIVDDEFEDPDATQASDADAVETRATDDEDDDDDSSSSSEDDEQGDELEGEKQLAKEERAKHKAQKRKAEKALVRPRVQTKRVKIDAPSKGPEDDGAVSSPGAAAAGKRKKSERVSWLYDGDDGGPTRTSSRTLSLQNKERTKASLKQSEAKRRRQIAVMEAANKRKAETKRGPLSQAERLAEAAETERVNKGSLRRWEEVEQDRVVRERKKLEAMQNRRLEGPVIRWWSGCAEWKDDKLAYVGRRPKVEEVEDVPKKSPDRPRKKKEKPSVTPVAPKAEPATETSEQPKPDVSDQPAVDPVANQPHDAEASEQPKTDMSDQPAVDPATNQPDLAEVSEQPKPDMPDQPNPEPVEKTPAPPPNDVANAEELQPLHEEGPTNQLLDGIEVFAASPEPAQGEPAQQSQPEQLPPTQIPYLPSTIAHTTFFTSRGPISTHLNAALGPGTLAPASPPPPRTPKIEHSARNTISLLNFDPSVSRSLDLQRRILFGWVANSVPYNTKPAKPVQPQCAITSQPAKYKDPLTGLPYSSLESFRKIRNLAGAGMGAAEKPPPAAWSSLLGAWVGSDSLAAKGVPDGFLPGTSAVKPDAPVEGTADGGLKAEERPASNAGNLYDI